MKKFTQLIAMLLLSMNIAGTKAQDAVLSSGGDASGSGGTASYSVGQVADAYFSGANGSSNAGVQQPFELFAVGLNETEQIRLSMTLFPNPAQTTVNLTVEIQNLDNLCYELYDTHSKLIIYRQINSAVTQVPTHDLAPGTYFLHVMNSGHPVRTFSFVKYN